MKGPQSLRQMMLPLSAAVLLPLLLGRDAASQPPSAASAAFDTYTAQLERTIASPQYRLVLLPASASGLSPGTTEPQLQHIAIPGSELLTGALLQHWRGIVFVPGATASGLEHLLRNVQAYPVVFSPEIISASATAGDANHLQTALRVRQRHVLTVVLETGYDVSFGQAAPDRGFTLSRSTHIYELDAPGSTHERVLAPGEAHGFLWRLNSYWSYQEREGGLLVELQTVSLSRSIPTGLRWIVGPLVESIPRESLAFTLRSATRALQQQTHLQSR